jgi:hypothetical protein
VVAVLVRDEDEVGGDAFDRRIVELNSARGRGAHISERVDEDRLLPDE